MDDFLAGQGGEVINICDNVDRYKMPAMIVKNEGKGNGVHTRLVNVSDVAKSLHISPDYIVRFLGLSLATNTTYTAESGEGDLRGTIQKKDVRAAVRRFVDTIIRCPGSGTNKCGLPELVFEGKGKAKKAKLSYNCLACGASGIFGSRDAAAERVADIMARDLVIAKKARKNKRKDKDFSGPSTPDTDGTMPAAPVEDDDSGGEENVHGMGNAALEGIDDDYFQAAFAAAEDADVSWGDDAEDADERAKEEIANSALLARLVSTDAAVAAGPKIKDDYECSDDARALAEWLMASLKGDAPAVTAHLGELVEAKQLGEAEFVLLFWEAAAAVSGGGPRTTPLSSVLRRYAEGLAPLASASKKCEKTLLGSIEAHFGNDDNSPDLPKVVKALVRTGCVKRKVVKKWLTKKKKSKFVSNEILASIQETVMEKCGDWLDAGSTTSWSNSLSDSNAEGGDGGDGGDDGDDGSSSSGSYYSGSSGSSDGVAIGFKASTAADGDMPVVADESDSGDDGTADSDRGGFGAPAPAAAAAGGGDDGSDSSFDIDDI